MPIDETEVATNYFRHLHSEYADKMRSLVYIKTAIDSLKQNDCQFVMTFMDPLISCQKWHNTHATLDLQRYVEPYLSDFAGKTFLQWSRDLDFEISFNDHPLEDAHRAAADLVLANWNHYVRS